MNRRLLSHLLVAAGVLLLLTPLASRGWEVWQQQRLLRQFERQLAGASPGVTLGKPALPGPDPSEAEPPSDPEPAPGEPAAGGPDEPDADAPAPGAPVPPPQPPPVAAPRPAPIFRLDIPAIGGAYVVMPDIGNEELARGPGHYPETPLPGAGGNTGVAGHRTFRGHPSFFYHLNRLKEGDLIHVIYLDQSLTYVVERSFIVHPYDLWVLDPTDTPTLTLTTCDPPGTEDMRLIVRARLQ